MTAIPKKGNMPGKRHDPSCSVSRIPHAGRAIVPGHGRRGPSCRPPPQLAFGRCHWRPVPRASSHGPKWNPPTVSAGGRALYLVPHFKLIPRNRTGRLGCAVIRVCSGFYVAAAQRQADGQENHLLVLSIQRCGGWAHMGPMGCVGPRSGTPPSDSDSHVADALATAILNLPPGAAAERRVNRRAVAGP